MTVYSLRYRGYVVRLIDTPGFDDSKKPDVEILNDIAYWLTRAYAAEPRLLLSGIVYLHPIHEPRMQGTAKKNLNMFKLLCGEESLRCVVLATTMWSKVFKSEGQGRQDELVATERFWGNMVAHGSKVFKHEDNAASAFGIIDRIIDNKQPVVLDIQREIVEERKPVDETNAGKSQRETELRAKERAERGLRESEETLRDALEKEETANVKSLLEEQEKYKRQIQEKEKNLQSMKMDNDAFRQRQEEQSKAEAERTEKATKAQEAKIQEIDKELQDMKKARDDAIKESEEQEKKKTDLAEKIQALDLQRNVNAMIDQRRWEYSELSRQIDQARLAAQLEAMRINSQIDSMRQQQISYQGGSDDLSVADSIQIGAAAGTGIGYGVAALSALMCTLM